MEVRLAKTAGFCMGVKRAVDIAIDIAQHKGNENVYTYGPIIHNPQTVELLRKRGIVPVDGVDEIKDGAVIIRAHGISPQERKKLSEKGVRIIDATCPKVLRVQSIIKKYKSLGYGIIIVGDKEHPEVVSLHGYSEGEGIVIAGEDDVEGLPFLEKVCVVAQTTQNSSNYKKIVEKIKEKFPDVVVFNTVCDSTEERQAEVRKMVTEMDGMVIVGGKNSANTRRLATISQEHKVPTFYIETVDELENINIEGYKKIGISAGASTPNWTIDGVVDYLVHYKENGRNRYLKSLFAFWIFSIRTDMYSAIGAGCLSVASTLMQKAGINILGIVIASFYVFAMHTVNRLQDRNLGRVKGSFREEGYTKYKKVYMLAAIASLALSLAMSFIVGFASFALLLFISVLGMGYNIMIFPEKWHLKRLVDIPGSKNIFIAAAWASVIVLVPVISTGLKVTTEMTAAFIFVLSLVFMKSVLSDMIDIQSDRIVGRETMPVVMGKDNASRLLRGVSVFTGIFLVVSFIAGYSSSIGMALLVPVFYIWICIKLCDKRLQLSGIVLEGLLGTSYIIAGLSSCLWLIIGRYVVA